MNRKTTRSRWLSGGVTAGLAALAVGLGGATSAHATTEYYCQVSQVAYSNCEGPRHSLTGNTVYDYSGSDSVCAGAHDTSHNMYGSFICGAGSAYHPYGGSNLLYPLARNNAGFGQSIFGVMTY